MLRKKLSFIFNSFVEIPKCGSTSEESEGGQGGRGGLLAGGLLAGGAQCVQDVKHGVASLARSCECVDSHRPDYLRYIRTAMLADKVSHDAYAASKDLIYNLSDVEKFLPEIEHESPCENVTRKRKERQDSGSFALQERKVIRSDSEERTAQADAADDDIRRVSSHEDFEKCRKPCRAPAAPLHEQNCGSAGSVARSPSGADVDFDAVYIKDGNLHSGAGDKFSPIFGQSVEKEHASADCHVGRQKYSKNDCSPSRSRMHDYILFPKRISPNRDPRGEAGSGPGCGAAPGGERDHERLRCSERRSRTPAPRGRRPPPRRQQRHKPQDAGKAASKENDVTSSADKAQCFLQKSAAPSGGPKRGESIEKHPSVGNLSQNLVVTPLPYTRREPPDLLTGYRRADSPPVRSERGLAGALSDTAVKSEHRRAVRDRSQSPGLQSASPNKRAPILDLTTLHEQLGQAEPLPSVPTKFTGFPWDPEITRDISDFHAGSEPLLDDNSIGYNKEICEIVRSQRRTLPDVKCDGVLPESSGGFAVVEPDERLNKIGKKLQTLKKKIAKCEVEFELSHGNRASHADKMNDSNLSKLYAEVRRLKMERKNIRAGPAESMSRPIAADSTSGEHSLKNKPMTDIMAEIERRLDAKRQAHSRPERLEACSPQQLAEEKAAVQRALLWLEGARGRPHARHERDAARPLYDRYRAVKRLVARFEAMKLNTSIGELATIMEHETMLFTNSDSPAESPEAKERPCNSDSGNSTVELLSDKKDMEDPTSSSAKSTASDDTNANGDDATAVVNENLHCLPLKDLNRLLVETKALKASLRSNIKAFEADFEAQNSRKLLKDERQSILPTYAKYKETKARLRLLTALVNKQKKFNG